MKTIILCICSFLIGVGATGCIGLKMWFEVTNEAILSKLHDNVTFYRQIESGKPELVQSAISGSLEWFIKMAEDGENSFWINNNNMAADIIAKGKKLQSELQAKSNKAVNKD